jgi:Xaa-Pro aminopeptidase
VPHAPSNCLSRRHGAIRQALRDASLDALVVVSLPNIAYLTNFAGSSAILVLTGDKAVFITDSRYVAAVTETNQTAHACPDFDLLVVGGSYDATLAAWLSKAGLERVGFEAAHLTVSRYRWLESRLTAGPRAPELVAVDGLIEIARSVKDHYEVEVLRRAGAMLSDVARSVLGLARPGVTEGDLALEIDVAIRHAGFEKGAFETIVASGPNAALPHARPTGRKLSEGDLVVLDFGGVHDSYCVDLTRTVAVGTASARQREVYDAVRVAHDRAIEASGPGRSRFAIDAAARDSLAAAGMGAAFGHGTGHGLGLEVHEEPRLTKRSPAVDATRELVTPGMVFTIEPGAYFPGWGGVRIEDDVLVTESGVERLTDAPTELIVV